MSKKWSNFIPDSYPESRAGVSQEFHLDEHVRQAKALKSDFIINLDHQRKTEPSPSSKRGQGETEPSAEALQKLRDEAAQIEEEARKEGYQKGREEGYQAGIEEAREQFAPVLEAVQALVEELSALRKQSYDRVEREMVALVTTLARKVIRAELKGKEDGIREIVRLAIESVLDRKSLVVKTHPDDHKELKGFGKELIQMFHDIKNVKMEAHASVERGHCVVESNFGTVEAGLDHLDEHIERLLKLAPPSPVPPKNRQAPEEPGSSS